MLLLPIPIVKEVVRAKPDGLEFEACPGVLVDAVRLGRAVAAARCRLEALGGMRIG